MIYFIDSNIFLRAFTADNKGMFQECVSFLGAVKVGKIKAKTSSLVLSELVWTLSSFYKFKKDEVIEALGSASHIPGLVIFDKYQSDVAIENFKNFNIKYIDSLIASIPQIQERKWTVVSYDKDFDKLVIFRKEPGEISF